MGFPETIKKNLICLSCKSSLETIVIGSDTIKCSNCQLNYPLINNIPVIINETESIFSFSDFTKQRNLFFDISKKGKSVSFISKVIPSIGGNNLGKRNFKFLETFLKNNNSENKPKVLVIGGSIVGDGMSDFVNSKSLDIVEGDVSFGPRTKIIFDAHSIPYKDESFDCIIAQAVLEHVIDPIRCVQEIHRVLKPNGIVYAETPFMQQVHGGPYDFTRYTRSGHRKLFQHFIEIESGATAGSGTALAWSYQYFLLALFGYTQRLRFLIKFFARITGFWLKYFDYLTQHNIRDDDGASGFYFIGTKSTEQLSDKVLINYYFNSKK
jgi:SAM-dependent methyltransferase